MNLHLRKEIALIALTCCVSPVIAQGANVVLRERATLSGSIVRLGDVADISADSTAKLKDLTTTPLVPGPAPGSQQFLHQSEVRDLLVSRGIDVQSLQFSGASAVAIGQLSKDGDNIGFNSQLPVPRQEIESKLQSAIDRHLLQETGHDRWKIVLQLDESAFREISRLTASFIIEGGRAPWTGRQQFQLGDGGTDILVNVRADVKKIQSVLFARRAIQHGDVIRAADVEVREQEERLPSQALSLMDQVVGMEAARSISVDAIVLESHVRAPLQVQRGETVTVYARTGNIAVRTYVVARQDGAMGELVQVETLDGKQRFAARVSGRRRLEVLAAGAQAKDYATLGNDTLRR